MENTLSSQETPIHARNRMCELNFQLADSNFDKQNPSLYTIEQQVEDELYEVIALQSRISDQTMYLQRAVGGAEAQTSFPFTLSENLIGIDMNSGEPCDVWMRYRMDTQGKFHLIQQIGDRTVVALCGQNEQARLNNFLKNSDLAQYEQYNDSSQ